MPQQLADPLELTVAVKTAAVHVNAKEWLAGTTQSGMLMEEGGNIGMHLHVWVLGTGCGTIPPIRLNESGISTAVHRAQDIRG